MTDWSELTDWMSPILILAATWITAALVRFLLSKPFSSKKSFVLAISQQSDLIGRFIYLIGLKFFIEAAPLPPKAQIWANNAIYIVTILLILWIARRVTLFAVHWSWNGSWNGTSAAMKAGFIPMIRNLITIFFFIVGAIMVLKHFGYDVMSLITALGVGSLAVGLAAKDTLSNMISGFTLIIDRNLVPGDWINLGGATGEVQEIGLRSTRILTPSGDTLIVPNSELVNTKILNLSTPSKAALVNSSVKLPYSAPFDAVKKLALESVTEVPGAQSQQPKTVSLLGLGDGFQTIRISFWISDVVDESQAISVFNERFLGRLQAQKIPLVAPPAV